MFVSCFLIRTGFRVFDFVLKIKSPPLILHQNATCGVAFSPIPLRRMSDTPQALGLLRLASDILLVIRNFAE